MAIALRSDFNAVAVRSFAKKSKDGPQARRLLALAAIYEGASRTEAAKIGGVTLQIVRDWVDLIELVRGGRDRDSDRSPRRSGDAARCKSRAHRPSAFATSGQKRSRFRRSLRTRRTPPNHGCAECRSPRRPSFRDR